jgi:hypothetical protein
MVAVASRPFITMAAEPEASKEPSNRARSPREATRSGSYGPQKRIGRSKHTTTIHHSDRDGVLVSRTSGILRPLWGLRMT